MIALFPRARLPLAARSAALLGLSLASSPAWAQLNVDLSARAGVSTNPLQGAGSTPTAGTATLGIRPSWTSRGELTTVVLSGYAETAFYTADYGTNANISAQGSATHRVSEYTTLSAALGYTNAIVGSFNGVGGVPGFPVAGLPPVIGTTPAPDGAATVAPVIEPSLPYTAIDPTLGQIGRRQQSYLATASLATALSLRDQLSFDTGVLANRANGEGISDFNSVTPGVAYSRTLGERFSVGVRFSANVTDYLGTSVGDATIYQPALTVTRGIGSRWMLSASLGAAIADLNQINGGNRSYTTLNGSAELCRQDDRWSACFNAARQTLPSTFQGVRTQTSLGGSLAYRVSARDDLAFNASYSHASDPIQRDIIGPRDGSIDFATAVGSYSRRIAPALFGSITLGYTKTFGDVIKRDANLTALAGVTYRLGRQP